METIDPVKAARVWQRVQNAATANPTQGLPGMIAEEWADAAMYQALSKRVQGNAANILRKMSQEEQNHMACLKGMYTLQGAGRPDPSFIRRSSEMLFLPCAIIFLSFIIIYCIVGFERRSYASFLRHYFHH